ncbi:hypothetical protein DRO97_05085 [Archaeoglobales archaeon]|nr:MAG: hypothetical protein DRO97_05085 [Archaeoglobales archaeon]
MLNVFDDKKSFGHTIAGIFTYFIPIVFVFFVFYEVIEHIYLAGKEKEANFLGDIVEFLFGLGLITITMRFMCF